MKMKEKQMAKKRNNNNNNTNNDHKRCEKIEKFFIRYICNWWHMFVQLKISSTLDICIMDIKFMHDNNKYK